MCMLSIHDVDREAHVHPCAINLTVFLKTCDKPQSNVTYTHMQAMGLLNMWSASCSSSCAVGVLSTS